jgi:hypothetical protein
MEDRKNSQKFQTKILPLGSVGVGEEIRLNCILRNTGLDASALG